MPPEEEEPLLNTSVFIPDKIQSEITHHISDTQRYTWVDANYTVSNQGSISFPVVNKSGSFGPSVYSENDLYPPIITEEQFVTAPQAQREMLSQLILGIDPYEGARLKNYVYVHDKISARYYRHQFDLDTLEGGTTLLDKLIRLYTTYMAQDVRSPIPHLVGPPGVGKSLSVEQLASLTGKKLHVVNVSRINVLELEGVQMPVGTHEGGDYRLHLLTSTLWSQLSEGDIVLLDEFLRGFPEVYNGLLDIMTSRQVAGFPLPKVFFIGASNSVATYDKALDDRLLHIPVVDVRSNKRARQDLKELIVRELGLMPDTANLPEMEALVTQEIDPTYEMLDHFKKGSGFTVGATASVQGQSARKLIGQAKLREVQSKALSELIAMNNLIAMQQNKAQFVLLMTGNKSLPPTYMAEAKQLVGHPRLTEIQRINLDLNLQLVEMEAATKESKKEDTEDEAD